MRDLRIESLVSKSRIILDSRFSESELGMKAVILDFRDSRLNMC